MPDVEMAVVTWGRDSLASMRFCTELPGATSFANSLPITRVNRIGGPRRYALEAAMVVFDTYAVGRAAARSEALALEEALYLSLPGTTVGGAVISHVAVISGPAWAPYDNTDVRRFIQTHQIHLKNA